jgi:hypothetical protein
VNHIPSPLPTTSDENIERAIKAAGADKAPRVTPADIAANIASEHYFTAMDGIVGAADSPSIVAGTPPQSPLDLLTLCVLVLRNGFTVTGESACASPENFNPEIGRKIAREKAVDKVWALMGYELKCRLANTPPDDGALTDADALADLLGTPRPDHPTV